MAGSLLTLNFNASEQFQQLSHDCEGKREWIEHRLVASQVGYAQWNSSPHIGAHFYPTATGFLFAAIGNLDKS
jgi:hypothetical protein